MSKRILVTGASSGFGRLTVEALLKEGHTVIASMRNVNGKNANSAAELKEQGALIVELDVTDESSVTSGIEDAVNQTGGIDVVVNNAGVGLIGFQENFTIEDWKKIFEVNVFGVQRVNRAVIPVMRKQGEGLLVHVSSLLGRMTIPFYGPYNASKWAVEALAENYRAELSAFGIESVIVEPGGFPTNFFDGLIRPSDNSRDEAYGEYIHAPQQMFESFEGALAGNPEQRPSLVSEAIVNIVNAPRGQRSMRTVVDKMGMGAPLLDYNQQLENITRGVYSNFGIANMLDVTAEEESTA